MNAHQTQLAIIIMIYFSGGVFLEQSTSCQNLT